MQGLWCHIIQIFRFVLNTFILGPVPPLFFLIEGWLVFLFTLVFTEPVFFSKFIGHDFVWWQRVEGDVATGTMMPSDVGQLASQVLLRHSNHTIHQDVYFLQPIMADLEVKGLVHLNGVNLDDVVTLGGTNIITGKFPLNTFS